MTYRSFSFIPTFSNNLLSDRFTQMDKLFSRLTGEKPMMDTPSYNLLQKDKDHYEMNVSVPGYDLNELDISVLNNQLTISGIPKIEESDSSEDKNEIKWLHQGFRKSEFSLSFNLEHRITIQEALLNKGLLILRFVYDIPEREKPKKIVIAAQNESMRQVIENNATN